MTSQNAEADCCDRAQELTDKIPPCTRQYLLQMVTGSYRNFLQITWYPVNCI